MERAWAGEQRGKKKKSANKQNSKKRGNLLEAKYKILSIDYCQKRKKKWSVL